MSRQTSRRQPVSPVEPMLGATKRLGAATASFTHAVGGRLDLNPTEFECLDIVESRGSTTPGQLAELTGLTSGAISGILDRLERAGWVQRGRDESDARRVIVRTVADRNAEVMPLFAGLLEELRDLATDLGPAEVAMVMSVMERLSEAMLREAVRLRAEGRAGLVARPRT